MREASPSERFAERVVEGIDDGGARERVVLWIEWREDGSWASAALSIPSTAPTAEPSADDVIFEGYELEDALDHANEALEDEVRVLEEEGLDVKVDALHAQGDPPEARAPLSPRDVEDFLGAPGSRRGC